MDSQDEERDEEETSGSEGTGETDSGTDSGTGGGNPPATKESSVAEKSLEQTTKNTQEKLAKAAKNNAGKQSLMKVIAHILMPIFGIIVALIIIIGIIMFLVTMPGMVMEQLKALFRTAGNFIAAYFGADTTQQIEDTKIYETLDYLESMGFDLKGEGLLTDYLDESDVSKLDEVEKENGYHLDSDVGVIRDDNDNIIKAESDFLFTYMVSDNYVYTIKNGNLATQNDADNWFEAIVTGAFTAIYKYYNAIWGPVFDFLGITEAAGDKWGTGLLAFYYDNGVGTEHNGYVNTGSLWNWDSIEIDVENKKLLIARNELFNNNNAMEFSLDGWTGRYGMPLEFLLSVHKATMMPDLAYDMATTFNTNVNIYLHDISGTATAAYKSESGNFVEYPDLEKATKLFKSTNWFTSLINWFDDLIDSDAEIAAAKDLGIDVANGENGCECEWNEVYFDSTGQYVLSKDEDGNYHYQQDVKDEDGNVIHENDSIYDDGGVQVVTTITKGCSRCRSKLGYIQEVLGANNDYHYLAYFPYVASVVNHWYRDVYFVETNESFVDYDYEYEAIMNERWTLYETYTNTKDGLSSDELYKYNASKAGDYILYAVNKDGEYAKSTEEIENYDSTMFEKAGNYYIFKGTQDDATTAQIAVAKKAVTIDSTDTNVLKDLGWTENNGIWSAYQEKTGKSNTGYEQLYPESELEKLEDGSVEKEVKSRAYINVLTSGNIIQTGEGQRTETNAKIKKMFLTNTYFRYDGSALTAEVITKLRNENNIAYGALSDADLTKETTIKEQVTKDDGTTEVKETQYTVADVSGQVSLNQDSLNAFSMLENTHTLDADYIYRDFKELIVELGYFTKEELTDETPRLLQWIVPDIGSYGYPERSIDKRENEFGTMIHSEGDLEANTKYTLVEMYKKAEEERENGTRKEDDVDSGAIVEDETQNDATVNKKSTKSISGISDENSFNLGYSSTNITDMIKGFSSDIERTPESGDGYEYKVTVGSVEYTHYYQFQGSYEGNSFWNGTIHSCGCGPTSCCNILTGYGQDVTPADTAGFLKTLSSNADLVKVLDNWGVSSQWIDGKSDSEYAQLMEEAFSEGKPIIMLMQASKGGDTFWTTGGHFVAVVGVDSSGNLITIDPGSSNPERHTYTKGIEGAVKYMTGILIPDEAPTGAKQSSGDTYKGYEGNEAVVSPVTGILLDYGVYDGEIDSITGEEYRVNVDLKYGPVNMLFESDESSSENSQSTTDNQTDSETEGRIVSDKVGYAKILVLDTDSYTKLESNTANKWKELNDGNGLLKESGTYLEELNNEDELDDMSDLDKTIYGYKEFVEKYESFGISGYVIYIDGFKCNLPGEMDEDGNITKDGDALTLDSFKDAITTSSFDSDGNIKDTNKMIESKYEKDDEYKTASEKINNKLNAENTVKDEALSTIYVDGIKITIPSNDQKNSTKTTEYEGIFIKEGTVIGRTYTDKELVEDVRGENYEDYREDANSSSGDNSTSTSNSKTTDEENEDKLVGNYLRIIMRDLDTTVVEDVESYMKLDEGGEAEQQFDTFSIIGTVLSKEEWVQMAKAYGDKVGADAIFRSESSLGELYDICVDHGVNPEYIFVRGIQESGLKGGNGNNYWGYNTPNGSGLWDGGTWQNVVTKYCETIVSYQDPTTWQYAEIMKRYNERKACTENGGIDPLGYGEPDTIGGQQCLYSWLGDDHSANSAGGGGMYYLYPWGWGGNQYEGENKIIFESKAEFEELCGSKHNTSGGKTSSVKTTVWEQGMYTAYQSRIIVNYAKSIFGEKAGTYK